MNFSHRDLQPELMDDPQIDTTHHRHALAGLSRVNWWSRTDAAIWNAVRELKTAAPDTPLRILDIACGGGDVAIRLARRFQKSGRSVSIHGCDISETAIQVATEKARRAGVSDVRFSSMNILTDSMVEKDYDVVLCSLFLHHLNDEDSRILLQQMRRGARQLVLIDDLRRCFSGYWLAWIGCRILTRCHIVHVDGPLSVKGAYTTSEALRLCHECGLDGATAKHHWPQRFLLQWRPTT